MNDPYTNQPDPAGNQAAQAPGANATKADLVEHAVSQGMDRTEAEQLSKDDLRTRYPAGQ